MKYLKNENCNLPLFAPNVWSPRGVYADPV